MHLRLVRPLPLAVAVVCGASAPAAVAVVCGASAPAAQADPGQTVIDATIYPGAAGSVSTQAVTLGTLAGCPLYSGSSPMYLYPGDQPYAPAANSSWALSTVITCGLGQPLNQVTEVQLENPSRGFENPLDNAEISDPSRYRDAAAPEALPVLSVDGTENQNTYVRPWLGSNDDNASDEVIADGAPITLIVYENGTPLSVSPSARTISKTKRSMLVRVSATVRDSAGAAIPASNLSWSWNFGDGTTAAAVSPRHSFVPGVFPVTVQVTDPRTGTGGTATIQVRFSPSSGAASGSPSGAGRSRKSRAPTGIARSQSRASGATSQPASKPQAGGGSASNPSPEDPAPQGSARPRAPSAPSTHGLPERPTHARRPRPTKSVPAPPPAGPVVSGRLISYLTPVAAATPFSPRALASAGVPAVRGASRPSVLPIVGSLLLIVSLFGLGAVRELRGAG